MWHAAVHHDLGASQSLLLSACVAGVRLILEWHCCSLLPLISEYCNCNRTAHEDYFDADAYADASSAHMSIDMTFLRNLHETN